MFRRALPWRGLVLALLSSAILGAIGLTLGIAAVALQVQWSLGDRLAILANGIAGAALLLTLVGAIAGVAVLAVATRTPRLEAEMQFRFSPADRPTFYLKDEPHPIGTPLAPWRQLEATVRVRNVSGVTARNPALRVDLIAMGGFQEQPGWRAVAGAQNLGTTALQWDGGADYAIHGHWTRDLPTLRLDGVFVIGPPPYKAAMVMEVVAEGFRNTRTLPVVIKPPGGAPPDLTER